MPRLFILWKGRVELTKDDGLVVYDWSPISILGTWIFVRPGLWFKALKFGMKDNRMRIWSKVTSVCLSTCVDALGKFSTLQLSENCTILTCLYWHVLTDCKKVAGANENLRSSVPCIAKECTQSHGLCKGSDCSRMSLHPNIYVTRNGEALVEVGVGGTEWARRLGL